MPQPVKPIVPPPALRSDPATFAVRAEDSINFWPTLTTYIDESATWIDEKSDELTALAALAGIPDLTGFAGRIPKVNPDEDAFIFTTSGRLEAIETGAAVSFGGAVSMPALTLTTDLAVAHGGTGASSAVQARVNLGLGDIATTNLIDEDSMVSNSAVRAPSQQSVKAYVDLDIARTVGIASFSSGGTGFVDFNIGGTATRVSNGVYYFTFNNAQPDTNYAVAIMVDGQNRELFSVTKLTNRVEWRTTTSGPGNTPTDAKTEIIVTRAR